MQKYLIALLASLFSLSIATSSNSAPLYEWVDENGVKHFSQQPPEHMPNMRPTNVSGIPSVSGENTTEQEQVAVTPETGSSEVIPEVEKVDNPVKSPELCEQARKNIQQLTDFRRVRAPDKETGELRYLSDEEKETQMANWQKRAETYCD